MRASAGALLLALLALGARRALADRSAPSWDEAWYLENAFRLHHALARGLPEFAAAWTEAFRTKAPLVSLTPLPLFALLGPSDAAGRLAALLAHGAAVAFTWAAGRSFWREHPRREGIAALAACLCALTPLLFGLSRLLLVESLLTALVAAAAWRLAEAAPERPAPRSLGLLLGSGLLAKVTFPLFVAGLAWRRRAALRPAAAPLLLWGGALAATWYAFNLPYVLAFAWSAAFGRVAADYAAASGGPGAFLLRLGGQALSWPLTTALAAVLAAAARKEGKGFLDAGTRLCLAWIAPLAVFAISPNAEIRFVAPALPAFALLGARGAAAFGRPGRALASALLLGAGLFVFHRETYASAFGQTMPWSGRPAAPAPFERGALVEAAASAAGEDGVAALALEDARLNANNLSAEAARRGLGLRVISLGYAQGSAEGALLRLKDKGAGALILVEGLETDPSAAFLNKANAGVAASVATGRLPASLRATVPLGSGASARVYRLAGSKW